MIPITSTRSFPHQNPNIIHILKGEPNIFFLNGHPYENPYSNHEKATFNLIPIYIFFTMNASLNREHLRKANGSDSRRFPGAFQGRRVYVPGGHIGK